MLKAILDELDEVLVLVLVAVLAGMVMMGIAMVAYL